MLLKPNFLRAWRRVRRQRLRVVLVPTDTYDLCSHGCDLHKVADRLNECQRCYEFVVLSTHRRNRRRPLPEGLALRKRKILFNGSIRKAAPKSISEREKAVDTYIVDTDAFEQIIDHARRKLNWMDDRQHIVIGIGGR